MDQTYKTFAKKLNEEIKCPTLKKILFKMDEPDASDIKGIATINRVLTFGFVFAFIKWKNDKRKKNISPSTPHANRVFDSFSSVYNGEKIGLDLIIYVLTEMQLDVATSSVGSYFYNIIKGGQGVDQVPSFRDLIKTWYQSLKHAEKDEKKLLEYLVGVYNLFPFLSNLEVSCKKEDGLPLELPFETVGFVFKGTNESETLDSYLILVKNNLGFCYLTSLERDKDAAPKQVYTSLDGVQMCEEDVKTDFFNRRASIRNSDSRPAPILAKSLFSMSFKYIRNLSLSISDTITLQTKQKLYAHFSHKYSDLFQLRLKREDDLTWDTWDTIITILMIEEGPTVLLEFILDSDGFYFERILEKLWTRYARYDNDDFVRRIKDQFDVAQKEELKKLKSYTDDSSSIVRNISAINRTLMAKGIIDGMASLEHDAQKKLNALYVESLESRIKYIDKIAASSDPNMTKVLKINKTLEKTFRYVIPFYKGIIAYQQEKEDPLNKYVDVKEDSIDKEKREAVLKKCEERFFGAAKASIAEIRKDSLGGLVAAFKTLCTSVVKIVGKEGKVQQVQQDGHLLKSAIGREYICSLSMDEFNKLLSLDIKKDNTMDKEKDNTTDKEKDNTMDKEKDNTTDKKKDNTTDKHRKQKSSDDNTQEDNKTILEDYPKDIVNFINNTKHDTTATAERANVVFFNKFVFSVKKLLYFLIYNQNIKSEMILGQQISYDPIYPYVVRYSTKSENRDGYNVNSFTVFPSDDEMSSEIKILSEREYTINEKYYCIPNASAPNSRWWIEPFMIRCRAYDDLIHGDVKDVKYDRGNDEGEDS